MFNLSSNCSSNRNFLRRATFAFLAIAVAAGTLHAETKYFLTPQRLRRLKRDRERQTPRWTNFETRVNTVKDSPERGLELALYYVVTGDRSSGAAAQDWLKLHPCDKRQSFLIQNWVGHEVASPLNDPGLPVTGCGVADDARVRLLESLAQSNDPDSALSATVIKALESGGYMRGTDLYAAAEFLTLWREATHVDVREQSPHFFSSLPVRLLLSMKPETVEHPDWQMHVAALALVSLDPNSSDAQFLQGWAMEDRQMLRDGPGVLYELLWADPYLPGVGYQNLDPWLYDDASDMLLARSDWSPKPCWVQILGGKTEEHGCPPNWADQPSHFGHLDLMPFSGKCTEVAHPPNQSVILSKLAPGQKLRYSDGGDKPQVATAGTAGLWRVPVNVNGRVCLTR